MLKHFLGTSKKSKWIRSPDCSLIFLGWIIITNVTRTKRHRPVQLELGVSMEKTIKWIPVTRNRKVHLHDLVNGTSCLIYLFLPSVQHWPYQVSARLVFKTLVLSTFLYPVDLWIISFSSLLPTHPPTGAHTHEREREVVIPVWPCNNVCFFILIVPLIFILRYMILVFASLH